MTAAKHNTPPLTPLSATFSMIFAAGASQKRETNLKKDLAKNVKPIIMTQEHR